MSSENGFNSSASAPIAPFLDNTIARRRGRPKKSETTFPNASVQGGNGTFYGDQTSNPNGPTSSHRCQTSPIIDVVEDTPQFNSERTSTANNDRKRSLSRESEDTPNSGIIRKFKRQARKTCRVCGDKAFSYNFNVVTCESCKAFFRRNAFREKELRCPYENKCVMDKVTRRFCQLCRLKKCYDVGMKPEWILSEEEKVKRKQMIIDNKKAKLENYDDDAFENQVGASTSGMSITDHDEPDSSTSNRLIMASSILRLPADIEPISPAVPVPQRPGFRDDEYHPNMLGVSAPSYGTTENVANSQLPTSMYSPMVEAPELMDLSSNLRVSSLIKIPVKIPSHTSPSFNSVSMFGSPQESPSSYEINKPLVTDNFQAAFVAPNQMRLPINSLLQPTPSQTAQLVSPAPENNLPTFSAQNTYPITPTAIPSTPNVPQLPPTPLANPISALLSTLPSNDLLSSWPTQILSQQTSTQDCISLPKDALIKLLLTQIEFDKLSRERQDDKAREEKEKAERDRKCLCKCQCGKYPGDRPLLEQALNSLLHGYQGAQEPPQLTPQLETTRVPTSNSDPLENNAGERKDSQPNLSYNQEHWSRFFARSLEKELASSNLSSPGTPTSNLSNAPSFSNMNDSTRKISQSEQQNIKKQSQEKGFKAPHNLYGHKANDVHSNRGAMLNQSPQNRMDKNDVSVNSPTHMLDEDLDNIHEPEFYLLTSDDHLDLEEMVDANRIWSIPIDQKDAERHSNNPTNQVDLVNMADGAIRRLVKMTKKIANTCMEYLIFRGAMAYDAKANVWNGPSPNSGYTVKMDAMRETPIELFEASIRFYATFKEEWRTNERVMLLLGAIVLFNPTTPDLQDTCTVGNINRRYCIILKRLIYNICQNDMTKTNKEYKSLLGKLIALRPLNSKAIRMIEECDKSSVEPLVKEMFIQANPPMTTS